MELGLSQVSLIVFVTASFVIAAVVMVLRDLFATRGATAEGSGSLPVGSLRRAMTVADEAPARGLSGRVDQAFDRLVLETGIDASSAGAFAMLVATGVFTGGVLFLWNEEPLAGIIGMAMGMGGALWYLIYYRARRMRLIQEQLPDVLDLLSRAVRAGESLDQAVQLVGDETPAPLGPEFRVCSRQLEMGMSLPGTMKSLMRRNRMMEMRILATTLMVHRQTGGNLALTLERMAGVVRERVSYRRHMRAATGAGRTSAMLISIAGPVMFLLLFFWQFEHLRIMLESPLGQTFLVISVLLEIVGLFWISRMFGNDT